MPSQSDFGSIVVVDDEDMVLESLDSFLDRETDYDVHTFLSAEEALSFVEKNGMDLVISDYLMPGMDGITFLARVSEIDPDIPCILLTGYADKGNAIRAINEAGLFHYIEKPWENDELLVIIRNGLEKRELCRKLRQKMEELQKALAEVEQLKDRLQEENIYLQEELKVECNFEEIIGSSKTLDSVLKKVKQVTSTDATVLITGETGTGKELIARAVHNISSRAERPLVKVNCAALPSNLIESELFGHERGAFTGAHTRKIGRFELAHGGTIFLDEIGDLPMELQVKLLRVLQEGEFERLGGTQTLKVDVRVIAATNSELEKAIEEGRFREDLYYRLNVFPIKVPPLREHREDIPLLVRHFVQKFGARSAKRIETVPQKVMDDLQAYPWPGNVRELENIIERAVIVSPGSKLQLGDWPPATAKPPGAAADLSLEEVEKNHIIEVLEMTGWRVSGERGAAKILGLKPTTLEARMKKLGIERKR